MAGAGENSRHDLDHWKKALLSRDFDLVHTQLMMLDGDVTPTERVQLVQEIFTAVHQIEELTIGKRDCQDAELPPKDSVQAFQAKCNLLAAPETSRPTIGAVSEDTDAPVNRARRRLAGDQPNRPKSENSGNTYIHCPVCDVTSYLTGRRMGVRDDWYCNSCRLFKLRLDRRHSEGRALPSCEHEGTKIKTCKGCRRFRLQTFWFDKRQRVTYNLPLMDTDESNSDVERGGSDDMYDCELE